MIFQSLLPNYELFLLSLIFLFLLKHILLHLLVLFLHLDDQKILFQLYFYLILLHIFRILLNYHKMLGILLIIHFLCFLIYNFHHSLNHLFDNNVILYLQNYKYLYILFSKLTLETSISIYSLFLFIEFSSYSIFLFL